MKGAFGIPRGFFSSENTAFTLVAIVENVENVEDAKDAIPKLGSWRSEITTDFDFRI